MADARGLIDFRSRHVHTYLVCRVASCVSPQPLNSYGADVYS